MAATAISDLKKIEILTSVCCKGPVFVIMPNLMKIGQTVADKWQFLNGSRPPSFISEI